MSKLKKTREVILKVLSFFTLTILAISCGDETNSYSTCDNYSSKIFLGNINGGSLSEISGLAVSRKNEGIIWMHNDSGHTPSIYAINKDRELVKELIVDGIEQVDWEDIAIGPCGDGDCIFVGDIGDNDKNRDNIKIIVLPEPDVSADDKFSKLLVKDFEYYRFEYIDKPRDAEALIVDSNGTIYIFSKEDEMSNLFKIDQLQVSSLMQLEYVGSIQTDAMVTAADLHRGGNKLLLLTTAGLYEHEISSLKADKLIALSQMTNLVNGNIVHGEGAGYDSNSGEIFFTTETSGKAPPLYKLECR